MDEITLKNYRCFRDEQRARLAPLTLLVGENSTGKTSFLAMARVLAETAYGMRNPDFKEDPYDLGSFDEIVHHHGNSIEATETFEAEFRDKSIQENGTPLCFSYTFGKKGTTPVPIRRRISCEDIWMEQASAIDNPYTLQVGTSRGIWNLKLADDFIPPFIAIENVELAPHFFLLEEKFLKSQGERVCFEPLMKSPDFQDEDALMLKGLAYSGVWIGKRRPFAAAPVRSKPRRTYDPSQTSSRPEGDYVPMYLAALHSSDSDAWLKFKNLLEHFGKESGLFDEISIRILGERGSDPFQVQISKSGKGLKGPQHNLIDVGYGVSQALPLITELLRPDAPSLFLLQQPEVHLHPSAQAALGSLFCQIAGPERQLIVETHSDHLLDRVRMEVRDAGTSGIKPEDVSILFFERNALDVQIHSLRIDEEGNIVDAPNSYRTFFMQETARSLGL